MEQITVNINDEKMRLDAYLANEKKNLSRTMLQRLIEEGRYKKSIIKKMV